MANNNDQFSDLHLEDVEDYSADYPQSNSAVQGKYSDNENMAPMGANDGGGASGATNGKYRRSTCYAIARNNKWTVMTLGVVLVVIIGVLSAAVGKDQAQNAAGSAGDATGVVPVVIDPASVDQGVLANFKTSMESVYSRHELDTSVLQEDSPNTAARKALVWMSTDKNVNSIEHTEKLQRFVLATFFYATNQVPNFNIEQPAPWKTADNWMTTAHSCDWMGVVCNGEKQIMTIDLEKNRLSGSLPPELKIVARHLETLDLTSNSISMRGDDFDVFLSMNNLKTLLMDDNFMYHSSGLPSQMGALINLEKIRLSYNLFEGALESGDQPVIGGMTKLTHLEIESNFLTGDLPTAISQMPQLVYLYMRRNDMTFNLDFMKAGQNRDMFALWLDSNGLTGSIPTEIALMPDLASLSLTNSTLSGPIPTELGTLTNLRRLWLYNNKLTGNIPTQLNQLSQLEVVELHSNDLVGDMPSGICDAVGKADYEFKSLTSDCKSEVNCASPDCCTDCF
mmetsp:Transcript_51450/g.124220  ORF Transcript_51450/g.124220 Transcript_51450/m.124220 type:complete len:509 (+) Transcript_51450:213-1739(+)